MANEKDGNQYETAKTCEKCGESLRFLGMTDDGWLAVCSDERCATLHEGTL